MAMKCFYLSYFIFLEKFHFLMQNGSKPDFSRNPFSRQHNGLIPATGAAIPSRPQMVVPASTLTQPPIPANTILAPLPAAVVVPPPVSSLQTYGHINPQMHHHNSSNIQHLTTQMMVTANTVANSNHALSNLVAASSPSIWNEPLGNIQPLGSTSIQPSRSYTSPESSYYQNNRNANNYNAYAAGPVRAVGTWGGGKNVGEQRSDFESWSPDNSPSRRHEYLPGQYYRESSPNIRHGYRQPSGYQDHSSKQWPDYRR